MILIVDAETESLRRLQGLLRAEFELQTAEGVGEAIRVLRRQPVHVVMTAQRLPEMTGVALLGRVQQEWPDTIGVVLTAYCDVRAVIAASDTCRVFRYLLQPWDAEELEAVLRQACAEYREQQERRRVLSTLRRYHAECLAMVEGLRTGRCGTLNATGQGEAREIAVLGRALLDDLDRALAADGRPG